MNVAEVSKKVAEERRNRIKAEQLKNLSKVSLEDLFSHIAEGEVKTLNIVVKADVHGSVEAVKQALEKLSNEEVRVKCIHGGVGAITESDVMFASASNAIVIGFNVRPDSGARNLAEQEKVDVRTYRIIYQAIEDVEKRYEGYVQARIQRSAFGYNKRQKHVQGQLRRHDCGCIRSGRQGSAQCAGSRCSRRRGCS